MPGTGRQGRLVPGIELKLLPDGIMVKTLESNRHGCFAIYYLSDVGKIL